MKQSELMKSIANLTDFQKQKLESYILDALLLNEKDINYQPDTCPKCGIQSKMIKKGFNKGKQRYQCKSCNKIFNYNTNTITMYSKLERSVFQRIVLDTISCKSIKKTAADLNLSIPCVFENRHKFLVVLEQIIVNENMKLSGTIEIDETYVLESQKGNHSLKRKARKRGEPSNFRGLSHEQVCIVTTTDRNAHEIFKTVGFGKPTTTSIQQNFSSVVSNRSVIYSDGAFCYDKLAEITDCRLIQLKTYSSYNKVEHLNTLNSIHSMIKEKLKRFRGVATKYMNRYMHLFMFIRRFMEMDDNEFLPIMMRCIKSTHFTITRNALKKHNLVQCPC